MSVAGATVPVAEALTLKVPASHSVHVGAAVAVPTLEVYLPAAQTGRVVHLAASVVVDDADVVSLYLSAGHAVHTAWALAVDVVEVYVPGPHLLVVTQAPASVAMLEVEAAALNLPLPQLAQVGDAVQLPTTEV